MTERPDQTPASFGDPDRKMVLDRLGSSGIEMIEEAPPLLPETARAAWRFRSRERDLVADIFVVATGDEAADLWGRLGGDAAPTSPLDRQVGVSGRMVFDVRFVGAPEAAESGQWRLMAVSGALAGGE